MLGDPDSGQKGSVSRHDRSDLDRCLRVGHYDHIVPSFLPHPLWVGRGRAAICATRADALGYHQGRAARRCGTAHSGQGVAGLISQGGVSLGLMLMIEDKFPDLGAGVVALAMAMILGNILVGPVLLGQALSAAGGRTREAPEVLE